MRRLLLLMLCLAGCLGASAQETFSGYQIASEGAWCWFADPRATHYENESGTINMSYVGYIDVHGNIKATQYNWLTGAKNDVLVRSYFQPDDHNNPTFLVLPDERVLIIYSRHTDEPAFYYRVSVKPGDITMLGEEKKIVTANNTTYPSPFLMSDDPTHWYLCWRGISWHPTIARLTLPDANDNVKFDWGPYQMVQSTGARPYAKYYSNGKDKLYVTYTTGHPDNEQPNWVYFNVININGGGEPTLEDIKGNKLSTIKNGVFNVNKTSTYKSNYPYTVVDSPSDLRDWVWQIALDSNDKPCIAMVKINGGKSQHEYYYAKWTGSAWRLTDLADGGGKFHSSGTEYCYSGGEALDPQDPNTIYLSIPTDGDNGKVFEIWKYTLSDAGKVIAKEQLTKNSVKNNVRPYVLPNSKGSNLRLCWMNGDYYYWLVTKGYPKGYPTSLMCDYDWQPAGAPVAKEGCWSMIKDITMNASAYSGVLLTLSNGITYGLDASTHRPYITINGKRYNSSCQLYTSDNWATNSTGTGGDNWPTQLTTWNLGMTYDGEVLTTYRNGLIDQMIPCAITSTPEGAIAGAWTQQQVQQEMTKQILASICLPEKAVTDVVLPTKMGGESISWTTSNEKVISANGLFSAPKTETDVVLTATAGNATRTFTLHAMPRNIEQNLVARFTFDEPEDGITLKGKAKLNNGKLDLTGNTATAFSTNGYAIVAPEVMDSLRSYTIMFEATPKSLTAAPRLYDFGWNSGNSIFCRANTLVAGIKYAGGTTTMTSASTQLAANKTYNIAVTFDASTKITTIYLNGEPVGKGTENQNEAYMISQTGKCSRNYIGRTQWWDTSSANDNGDYVGTIDNFLIYNTALTQKEVCNAQGLPFEEKEYPTELANGNFEGKYSTLASSGVSTDRAIYVPEGWTVDYLTRNNNDFNALKSGDMQYSSFFATKAQNAQGGAKTMWIRQRWGSSNLGFYQELRLPEGEYLLSVDVFSSDATAKGYAYVNGEQKHATAINTWQTLTFGIDANGEEVQKIGLATIHDDSDAERIVAFDNFVLTPVITDNIAASASAADRDSQAYDLTGRPSTAKHRGIVIRNGKKIIQ